jgi:hypothetical protein
MDYIEEVLKLAAMACAGFLLGLIFGIDMTTNHNRQEAIEAGVAYYSIDEVTGERSFEYRKGDGAE